MAVYKVIDVSEWQGKIDWAKVKKAGVVGAIIRYADNDYVDKRFDENMTNAKAAGLHVGCYIFSRSKTRAEAERDATRLYNASKKYNPDMPLYIDLEVAAISKYADTVAPAFLNKMKSLGGRGGVYANLNWWNNYLKNTANNYSASPFWIAQYYTKMTYKDPGKMGMWQYSSSGKVDGISTRVDMNECYIAYWDTDTAVKPSEPVAPVQKPVENLMAVAREVIAGDWGSGDKRKAALEKAGYNYDAVQKEVNRLLCCRELIISNIKAWATKIANTHKYKYIYWTEPYGHECAVCHPHDGKNQGWQCIGWTIACWHHGGLPIPCNCGVIDNGTGEKILKAKTDAEALRIAQNELNLKDIKVIRNGGKLIPKEKAQPGDIALLFTGNTFQHMCLVMSDKYISDSTVAGGFNNDISAKRSFSGRYVSRLKVLIRYTGNGFTTPEKKTVDELAHEVIKGLWGSGDSRKTALTECGYDYDAIQARVNELLGTKSHYSGTFPSTTLTKTNAEVIADTITWAKWIAGDNRFHYGYGDGAHHNGCYFCGTQDKLKKGKGIVDYEFTYCCNPFVGAAWAHGGCVPKAIELCRKCSSWDFKKGAGYDKSTLFTNLGRPAKSSLKAGDVLCRDTHVALYIGDGKIAEASGADDNIKNSTKWNNSIHVTNLTDSNYKKFLRVHRFNSSVNTTSCIYHGEISKRVGHAQAFLKWYGIDLAVDNIFGDATFNAVKKFQQEQGITADGIIGPNTIAKMKEVMI